MLKKLLLSFSMLPFKFVGVMFTTEVVFFAVDDSLINRKDALFASNLYVAQVASHEGFHFSASLFLR
jgi:hypothetical protein